MFVKASLMSIDGSKWPKLYKWADERALLTKRDSDLLRAASRIPRFTLSGKNCEKILKIKKTWRPKASSFEGFSIKIFAVYIYRGTKLGQNVHI